MQTNFAYIDDVFVREAKRREATARTNGFSPQDQERARLRATKHVAGFAVTDEAEERRQLDALVQAQIASIRAFGKARQEIQARLAKVEGVTPLAIIPTKAWDELCTRAGLFRFKPDANSRVNASLEPFYDASKRRRRVFKFSPAAEFEHFARTDWEGYLRKLFPGGVEANRFTHSVTLLLPEPPPDVIALLLKAAELPLRVAAVAAAIGLRETPTDLYEIAQARAVADRRDEAARRAALRADPIVYFEHGAATAILAQFGEFPIEQAVVDAVVGLPDIFPEGVAAETAAVLHEQPYQRALLAQAQNLNQMQSYLNYPFPRRISP